MTHVNLMAKEGPHVGKLLSEQLYILEKICREIYAKSQGYCVQTALNNRFALLSNEVTR